MKLKNLLLMFLLFVPMFMMGANFVQDDPLTAGAIVASLAPIVVWAVTALLRKIGNINPMWTMLVVAGLSTLLTFITDQSDGDTQSFVMQIIYGLAAIAINEILKAFGVGKKS